ncbi:hypothetical protein AAWM_04597 [Aspergillus awamori]|uniref:Uncharacterized protein n=1 Tax=Aspergillus awamori TaxID=105351 RepID=A0A401KR44_ASPAW|nr:hypothetical protein AAWM_04597 [Aspergillus awamori]
MNLQQAIQHFFSVDTQHPVSENFISRITPNSLLSLCNLFDIHPNLPDYMSPNINLDRRGEYINELRTIYSVVTTIYASTQSTSEPTSTEDPLITATAGVVSSIDSDDTTSSTTAPTTFSDDDTATTTTQQPNVVTVTETRLVSTMYMTSVATQASSPNHNSTAGLSPVAKAGIGVAVPIAVAIIALLILAWFQRFRKRRQQMGGTGSEESGQDTTIQHAEGKNQDIIQNTTALLPEIDGAPLNESDSRPVHSSADRPVFELSTGSVRKPRRGDPEIGSGAAVIDGVNAKQGASGGEVASSASATLGEAPAELSSDGVRDGESIASVVAYERMSPSELQEELARVARSRERLQYLQMLEEREDMIRRVLAGHGEDAVSGAESRRNGGG